MDTWGERGSCPSCGSAEIVHLVFGLPSDPGSAPSWVRFGGCVISGVPDDRLCEACGHSWVAPTSPGDPGEAAAADRPRSRPRRRRPLPRPQPRRPPTSPPRSGPRLLSADGANFALIKVPSLAAEGDLPLADIELLTPDRLVRYLARPMSRTFLTRLADSWLAAAADPRPEASVPTVEDAEAGLAVLICDSTDLTVIIEVLVTTAPEDDLPEHDGVSFEVPRASLITAAHDLEEWWA